MELSQYIAKKLKISDLNQIQCIENIVNNSILLNEYQTGQLSEDKLDIFVKITGAYLSELLEVMSNPEIYKTKLNQLKREIGGRLSGKE